jgi:hypothetical protein
MRADPKSYGMVCDDLDKHTEPDALPCGISYEFK